MIFYLNKRLFQVLACSFMDKINRLVDIYRVFHHALLAHTAICLCTHDTKGIQPPREISKREQILWFSFQAQWMCRFWIGLLEGQWLYCLTTTWAVLWQERFNPLTALFGPFQLTYIIILNYQNHPSTPIICYPQLT